MVGTSERQKPHDCRGFDRHRRRGNLGTSPKLLADGQTFPGGSLYYIADTTGLFLKQVPHIFYSWLMIAMTHMSGNV